MLDQRRLSNIALGTCYLKRPSSSPWSQSPKRLPNRSADLRESDLPSFV